MSCDDSFFDVRKMSLDGPDFDPAMPGWYHEPRVLRNFIVQYRQGKIGTEQGLYVHFPDATLRSQHRAVEGTDSQAGDISSVFTE
jgi:hypothetical protein